MNPPIVELTYQNGAGFEVPERTSRSDDFEE
jgi:hypothetical protein